LDHAFDMWKAVTASSAGGGFFFLRPVNPLATPPRDHIPLRRRCAF
jgi:hypothetical protein